MSILWINNNLIFESKFTFNIAKNILSMGSFSLLKIVLLLSVAGQISGQWWKKDDCCHDLRCWEKCFEDVKDPRVRNAFNKIYKVEGLFD